jgi:hypothetical protein
MKRLIAIALTTMIVACAPTFDNQQYYLFAEINYYATKTMKRCDQRDETFVASSDKLLDGAGLLRSYLKHLGGDEDTKTMGDEIADLIDEFGNKKEMSILYCREKLTNIIDGTDRAMSAVAKKER